MGAIQEFPKPQAQHLLRSFLPQQSGGTLPPQLGSGEDAHEGPPQEEDGVGVYPRS